MNELMDKQGAYTSSWAIAEAAENQQRMMVSTTQLCTDMETAASLKVFTMVMLHTWRQRRKEVRELQEVVQRLQDNSMKSKNQLHVYGTLMRVEERRNRELQMKLKQSTMRIDQVRLSCESLVNSVRDLTTEKIRLQTDLDQRSLEYDELEEMSGKTKRLLCTAYMEQSQLKKQLTAEQGIRRKLEAEKEQLIQELVLAESRDDKYLHQLDKKNECIHILSRRMASLEEKLRDFTERTGELEQLRKSAKQMSNEITELRHEVSQYRTSFFRRIQDHVIATLQGCQMWTKLRRCSLNVMYLFGLYLLSGMSVNHHRK